jgi:Family of unknown function (DUF5687)
MYRTFFQHQWKYFCRSRSFEKNIVIQIVSILLGLYFLCGTFITGSSLKSILEQQYGSQNIIPAFYKITFYYFFFDIIIRFLWQELPSFVIQPYLVKNIKRKQLITFLNVHSLLTIFNIIPFLLFVPFIVSVIFKLDGNIIGVALVISLAAICIGNHFWILFIKRQTNNHVWIIAFILILFLLYILNYFKIISTNFLLEIIYARLLGVIPIIYCIAGFYFNNKLLQNHFYFENTSISAGQQIFIKNKLLQKITANGIFFNLDFKLILRNKRPKSMLMASLIFLFYGLLIFKGNAIEKGETGLPLLSSVLIVGLFSINYSQFIFSWQSSYFDGLLTYKINLKDYIKNKFSLITILCSIYFLLASFYILIDWRIIFILAAAYLYCIGVLPVIAIYLGTYNYKSLDISKSSSFNYQGTGAAQWIYSLLFLLIGIIIYVPLHVYYSPWYGVAGVGCMGFINLLLQKWWINILSNKFQKNKYKILEGFREN